MKKTIGILAHVDAGKTTFAEQILYHTNSIRSRGRVDHKNSFLDSHHIEKDRGITVFADQGIFNYKDSIYYLIDTPGHVDFSAEMERAIKLMDYAVIIISAVEGVQGHTQTVWDLLKSNKVPTFIFINKVDRVGANIENILEEINLKLSKDCCLITDSFNNGEMAEELIEFIAERDELLLEKYLEGNHEKELWLNYMKKLVKENKIFPILSGSALQDIGIIEFLDKFNELTYTEYNKEKDFSGLVYKIRHDDQGMRIAFIKALTGELKVKDEIGDEKVNQLRIYNGNKYKTVERVEAGDVFAVTGLLNVKAGDGVGYLKEKSKYEMIPTLKSKVIFDSKLNIKDVLNYFKILESEEPVLNVTWDENLQEIQVHIMGSIQLEVLKKLVEDRFNLIVEFGPCEVLYKETINSEVIGYGHFEPLRHYAEVHLKLEPGERNSGIKFYSKCHTDNLLPGYQNLVKTHIYEKNHRGILTGSTITDLKVTLLTGAAHNKHTSGGDFREATLRALRQGLDSAENILLEPYYKFKIEVELEHMGRVLSDIQKLHGEFDIPETMENKLTIRGRGPVANFMNYSMNLVSFTKGKGSISLIFDGYDRCHNEEDVIEKLAYNKNADPEYTSNSIFCSKGQGYVVEGEVAKDHMHCISNI